MRFPLLLIFSLAVSFLTTAEAEKTTYDNQQFKLSISFGGEWRQVTNPTLGSLLVLKDSTSDFPTFNILLVGKDYLVNRPIAEQEDELISSYSLAGIKDVQIDNSYVTQKDFGLVFESELTYRINDHKLYSKVMIIPQGDYYLALTYIDSDPSYKDSYQQLLETLRLPKVPQTTNETPTSSKSLLISLLCVSAVLGLRWYYAKRTR